MGKEKPILYATGSVPKLLAHTCIPAVITTLVVTFYHISDIFFIGQTGDAMQVAAITLSGPVFSVLSGLGTLIGSGGCAAIAMALGKKNSPRVKSLSSFCCYAAITAGLLFTLCVNIGMSGILRILNVTPDTEAYTREYLMIVSVGSPFLLFSSIFANIVRGEGAIKESLLGNGIGSMVNIILDPVLILTLGMGIAGAAIATIIGNMVSALYLVLYITGKKSQLSLNIKYFSLRKNIAWQTILLGLPVAFGIWIMSVHGTVINHVIGRYGDIAIAAYGVSGKTGMLIAMVQMGICMGIQPALAYNFGAGNIFRLKKIVRAAALVTVCTGTVLSLVSWFLRREILSAFIQNPQVIQYGMIFIVAGIITGPFLGFCYLSTGVLQAVEKIKLATVNALLRQGILSIPILLLLSSWVGLTGIVIAGVIVDTAAALAGAIISNTQLRKLHRPER